MILDRCFVLWPTRSGRVGLAFEFRGFLLHFCALQAYRVLIPQEIGRYITTEYVLFERAATLNEQIQLNYTLRIQKIPLLVLTDIYPCPNDLKLFLRISTFGIKTCVFSPSAHSFSSKGGRSRSPIFEIMKK
jgi:hypothetical protein